MHLLLGSDRRGRRSLQGCANKTGEALHKRHPERGKKDVKEPLAVLLKNAAAFFNEQDLDASKKRAARCEHA